jgi:endonuclease/exonuclease/phosphatase family metal-dependent hydrolase
MIRTTLLGRQSFAGVRSALASLLVAAFALVTGPIPASATAPAQAERRFTVMTYNVYLGANMQPLFAPVSDPLELIQRANDIFDHLDKVDFNVRAVAIAERIIENDPDVVALQEVSLWRTALRSTPTEIMVKYDFLQILLDQLARQGHPYRTVSVSQNFSGQLPISLTTDGLYTDRNAIIVPVDEAISELITSNPMDGVFETSLPVSIGGTPLEITRGWASTDVAIRGKTYRFFDTHVEAFDGRVRLGQVNELLQIMSESPYPVVLAGDINLYPMDVRPEDATTWDLLTRSGFVDAWVQADCFEPRHTAGQTDDLDNVPSILNNTVDYVLFDADDDLDAVEGSCDIAGEELDDRTNTVPAFWPSDHAAIVVDLHIAKP